MCSQRGGFPIIRHIEVHDLVGYLLLDVAIEPQLAAQIGEVFSASSTNTADDARADCGYSCSWLLDPGPRSFFYIRIFHPDAASYAEKALEKLLLQHEQQKKLEYNEHIVNVDCDIFFPPVFTTAGAA